MGNWWENILKEKMWHERNEYKYLVLQSIFFTFVIMRFFRGTFYICLR